MEVFEDEAKPDHFLRALVAIGCISRSNQEMGNSSIISGQDSLGQTPNLKSRSFCWRVRGAMSMASIILWRFSWIDTLADSLFLLTRTGMPRNLKESTSAGGMVWPLMVRPGKILFPVDAWMTRDLHLGTLAFSCAHSS